MSNNKIWFRDGNFIREVASGGLICEIYISPNLSDNESTVKHYMTAHAMITDGWTIDLDGELL